MTLTTRRTLAKIALLHGYFQPSMTEGWVDCPMRDCATRVRTTFVPTANKGDVIRALRAAVVEHLADEHEGDGT